MDNKWYSGFTDFNYLIGGSFSLWKFLKVHNHKNPTWQPDDIDIFTDINVDKVDKEIVETKLNSWKEAFGKQAVLEKIVYNDFYEWNLHGKNGFIPARNWRPDDNRKEDFDKAVVAVGTFNVPNAPRPKVQVILVDKKVYNEETLFSLLHRIADIKVMFYYYQNKKLWVHHSSDASKILAGKLYNLCPTRTQKYKDRGFTVINQDVPNSQNSIVYNMYLTLKNYIFG